jgi:hypothetical protein
LPHHAAAPRQVCRVLLVINCAAGGTALERACHVDILCKSGQFPLYQLDRNKYLTIAWLTSCVQGTNMALEDAVELARAIAK